MIKPIDEVIEALRADGITVTERRERPGGYRVIDFSDGDLRGIFEESGYFTIERQGGGLLWSFGQQANVDPEIRQRFKEKFFKKSF